jgi:hypothetical protein
MQELPPNLAESHVLNPVLTQEQEPAERIQDADKAYYMGHAMVANMDESLKYRQEAENPLANAMSWMKDGKMLLVGAKIPEESTLKAIRHEMQADKDGKYAGNAYEAFKHGQDSKTRGEGYNRLQELTSEDRPPTDPIPVNYDYGRELLAKDAAKRLALESLHKTLDGSQSESDSTEDSEAEFMKESNRITSESLPIKTEADKLAARFASGSKLEADTAAAKTMEQAARSATGIFRMGLREYFSPDRIIEWEKMGSLRHARKEISGQLTSIALSAGMGERHGDRFIPMRLDLFEDPQGVNDALEDIARRATGSQIIAVAQKSMKTLSMLHGYESIVQKPGKNLYQLEASLRRISSTLDAEQSPQSVEPERTRERQRISDEELRRMGRRPTTTERT